MMWPGGHHAATYGCLPSVTEMVRKPLLRPRFDVELELVHPLEIPDEAALRIR